ncbi:MAG: M24 family metallopeptidase [Candidatus Binatia bacterium]
MPVDIATLQAAVAAEGFDAWLFYDFRGSDPIGRRILGIGDRLATRRWFYCVPAHGEPRRLVSAVEPAVLDGLPGATRVYRSWAELQQGLAATVSGLGRVAMQYSPLAEVPTVSLVDAGTVELVRAAGAEVYSAADLIQRVEAVWTAEQYASHRRAAAVLRALVDAAFAEIAARCRAGRPAREGDVQRALLDGFAAQGLVTHHPPIVAADAHSADPHFETPAAGGAELGEGTFVLIDLWAKEPGGVYADITWTGFVGTSVPPRHAAVFAVVRAARDAGVAAIAEAVTAGRTLRGRDLDAVVRGVIEAAGYGERFVHRTGHSIGAEVHGTGANIDGFETPDGRCLLPGTCFSVEPGIYLPGEFGVRSEVDVFIDAGKAVVTGEPVQTAVVPILGIPAVA